MNTCDVLLFQTLLGLVYWTAVPNNLSDLKILYSKRSFLFRRLIRVDYLVRQAFELEFLPLTCHACNYGQVTLCELVFMSGDLNFRQLYSPPWLTYFTSSPLLRVIFYQKKFLLPLLDSQQYLKAFLATKIHKGCRDSAKHPHRLYRMVSSASL